MEKFLLWWERSLISALCLSIALLGIGRVEFFAGGGSMSAWSVSRTTFVFWCMLKLLLLIRAGWAGTRLASLESLTPLFLFFSAVTVSLLPDFRQAGDYRYFFFGCAHAVMLVDMFSAAPQRRWVPVLLGTLPVILVARGLAHDPAILSLSLSHRFGYPLDHPNTAGFLFAMSVPLCAVVAMANPGAWRALSWLSCAGQISALVLTFSRGAWLGFAAAMLYLTVGLKKWKPLAAFAVLAVACALVFPSIQDRLGTVTDPHDDPAMRERLQLLASSVRLGMDNPLFGVGYGRGRLKEPLRAHLKGSEFAHGPILHTHNVYVELFAGTGLVGLFAFLWMIGQTLLRLWRSSLGRFGTERVLGVGLAAAWIAAIVAGLGDILFYHHETRIFFFTLLGTAHIYYSSSETNEAFSNSRVGAL